MKSIISSLLVLVLISLVISSCKKNDNSVSADNNNTDNSNYFPSTVGSSYKYNFERTDSTNQQTTGTRDSTVYTSYFRKSNNGIYYFLDTTGFSENLPPEFISYLPYLKIDQELLLLPSSLQDGQTWPVFKVSLEQGISITVVDVEAKYLGKENVAVNLTSGTVTKPAAKIEYSFSIINPITQAKQTVTADGWYAADIGAVKWEGNSLLLNAFTRGEISFSDSTSTGSENLVQYSIK